MSFEDLIPVVNKLQDIVTTTQLSEIDLPILAVVGSQSCGKSSVLENIVGRDFLPRGTGIVTRRPLVLQLINIKAGEAVSQSSSQNTGSPSEDDSDEPQEVNLEEHLRRHMNGSTSTVNTSSDAVVEWGEFLHIPKKRFYNFAEIRREIEAETQRIAGGNKGISRVPINLKIYSTKVLNLTLVDLPGLTKIPIGDQPTDIERQTRNLILEYISKPNCIVLAVSPANVDLVNSESLKLARSVDPTGKRTVGVLSKLDLMDQGTNALDILKGNVYPLKLGFVGIVNRSQQDIAEHKSMEDSLQSEADFFANHPAYRAISTRCGTRYLAQTLNKILMNHIRERLPDIKAKLNTLMGQAEQELASYGPAPSLEDSKESRAAMVLALMTKFANMFVHSIEGTSLNELSTKELCGGARIYYIYNEVFGAQLASINPTHNLSVEDIRTAIRNSTGPRPSLFVPELAFDLLVKPQIKLLEEPSIHCVQSVYEELMKIVHNICSSKIGVEMNRYPRLQSKLIEVVSDLLRERLGPTTKYVESLIEIHTAYINTNHPNFVGAARAMSIVVEERKRQKELESRNKLRLASERILKKKDPEEDEAVEDKTLDDEINTVDDEIKPIRQKRSDSIKTSYSAKSEAPPESYLNYFFGKDPVTHQQHLQTQAQLNPTPFKFPSHSDGTLQFNANFINNGIQIHPNGNGANGAANANGTNAMNGTFEHMKNLHIDGMHPSDSFEADNAINDLTEREQLECELIRRLIVSYFSIVREMVLDQVPKSIMCLLVNYIKQHIQNRLVVRLYNEALFDDLLKEDEDIQAEREKCVELLRTYREASRIISDVV